MNRQRLFEYMYWVSDELHKQDGSGSHCKVGFYYGFTFPNFSGFVRNLSRCFVLQARQQVENGTWKGGSVLQHGVKAQTVRIPGRMFHLQQSLPRLPIPALQQTLDKYLLSARPLLTDEEFTHAENVGFLHNLRTHTPERVDFQLAGDVFVVMFC